MSAAGMTFSLHPACRVRREGFGLLFYDSRGPRLLFAATGDLLPEGYFDVPRSFDSFPDGISEKQKKTLAKFFSQLTRKGFLREQ